LILISEVEPVKTPAPDTDTDRTPAPDSNSRQAPDPLWVITTGSPLMDSWVVRNPATVVKTGVAAPSPTFNRKVLPFSAGMDIVPFINN
jgi:hypothetical protein